MTAGHRTLALGTRVRVVNRQNGRSVVVRINDRGPVQKKFEIDLSRGSARVLGFTGVAPVDIYAVE
jgi:rare lipoprotein A